MEFKKDGEIGLITVDGAEPFNDHGLTTVADGLSDAWAEVAGDSRFKVLVLLIEADQRVSHENHSSEVFGRIDAYGNAVENIAALDIPTIIGVDGDVQGPLLELALACDIRLATPASYFSFREITAGFMPCYGGTQRLARLVGKGKALEMMLTGALIDSDTAQRIHLVNRVVDRKDIRSSTLNLAREMGSRSPTSLAYVKEAILKGMDLTLEQGLRLEADLYYLIHTTHDRREGINAFKEKRKPVFGGN